MSKANHNSAQHMVISPLQQSTAILAFSTNNRQYILLK